MVISEENLPSEGEYYRNMSDFRGSVYKIERLHIPNNAPTFYDVRWLLTNLSGQYELDDLIGDVRIDYYTSPLYQTLIGVTNG